MIKIQAAVLLSLVAVACGGPLKYELKGAQLSPGSDAHVEAAVEPSRNLTKLSIDATNLTPPDRLVEGGKSYVVWARKGSDATWSRVGALDLNGDQRRGKAEVTVPETGFDLLISAERDVAAAAPSGKTVFEQRVQR